MNILGLFNGHGGGNIALELAGINIDKYFSSEIDKFAIQANQQNYPDTIQIGDVTKISGHDLPKIDLLLGGSPCQGFSFAGKREGMMGEEDVKIEITTLDQYLQLKKENFKFKGQSYLFWEYIRVLNECRNKNPDIKFMLENVRMEDKWKDILTKAIGVEAICINSALMSAQNRVRYYWANWKIEQPEDEKIFLKDILEDEDSIDSKYYLSEEQISKINLDKLHKYILRNSEDNLTLIGSAQKNCYIGRDKCSTLTSAMGMGGGQTPMAMIKVDKKEKDIKLLGHRKGYRRNSQVYDVEGKTECLDTCTGGGRHPHILVKMSKKGVIKKHQDKASCLTGGGHSGGNHSDMDILCVAQRGRNIVSGKRKDYKGAPTIQRLEPRKDGKTNCLTTVQKDNYVFLVGNNWYAIRRLTPRECARLQTIPEEFDFTGISDSQIYKMLGNGWTAKVIAHMLKSLHIPLSTANITADPSFFKLWEN